MSRQTDAPDLVGSECSNSSPHTRQVATTFASGLKRKFIHFVPASGEDAIDSMQETVQGTTTNHGSSIADFYLSLVLPSDSEPATPPTLNKSHLLRRDLRRDTGGPEIDNGSIEGSMMPSRYDHPTSLYPESPDNIDKNSQDNEESSDVSSSAVDIQPSKTAVEQHTNTNTIIRGDELCEICNIPVTDWGIHVRTTAHMASVEHSKIPHHLNRQSEGYKHMVKLGWDPDSDKGLGPDGRGIRFPVKATPKKDNLGIGAKFAKSIRGNTVKDVSKKDSKKPRLLNAKETRRLDQADRAARQDLHEYLRH